MRLLALLTYFLLLLSKSFSAVPVNDNIGEARALNSVIGYCSGEAEFSNIEATPSGYRKAKFWNSEGNDVWFKFEAVRTDVTIVLTGKKQGNQNTLLSPLVAIYTYDGTTLTEMIGSMTMVENSTNAYKGGLSIGKTYYIRISAENNATGTFQICLNNYNPPTKPGQDCESASILCNKETFSETSITGAGNNNKEAAGTCLSGESNSAWYKWTAANNGTLTFTITPTAVTDDIDWVLYDLGINGDCSNINASNAIRCAAGNGINCNPSYYITGLNMSSTDVSEQRNCPPGQDGWLKYVDMEAGHTYALLIDNFSNGENGFTLSFGGTGEFRGPKADIVLTKNDQCSTYQSYTFTAGTGMYTQLKWSFGEGANIAEATDAGPHLITYGSNGQKNIILEATNASGCAVVSYYNMYVADKPAKPVISPSKTVLCVDDELVLQTPELERASYYWSGPNGFVSTERNPAITITGPENAGDYTLVTKIGDCESDPAVINIPPIPRKIIPDFYTNPSFNGKYATPIEISFINRSINADSYSWNFGDGSSSSETNPIHTYTKEGNYDISLTAFSSNSCFATKTQGKLVVLKEGTAFIPSSFSPNGDGTNDDFQISIANLKNYRLTIFNRWGTKIFETREVLVNWDGKCKDQDVPVGVYYYVLTAKDKNNNEVKQTASITLIR